MKRRLFIRVFFLIGLLTIIAAQPILAENTLESDLQQNLEKSRGLIVLLKARLEEGAELAATLNLFTAATEEVHAGHLLLLERFSRRQSRVDALGGRAAQRHQQMVAAYRRLVEGYLELALTLQSVEDVAPETLDRLLERLVPLFKPKKHRVYGSLPYRHLNLAAAAPVTTPTVSPAYQGGNQTVAAEDTQDTAIAPINLTIAQLAESLNWEPAAIYDWVKNNIRTEWYWGCMKGAEDTLRQRSGNDCDQATLLVALLRASGYPARYVRGVMAFFPDLDAVMMQTGCQSTDELSAFFTHAGIPFTPVDDGTGIVNYQLEHIWVEAQVPYANYRGALVDDSGRVWLGMDTSIKNAGYTATAPVEVLDTFSLASVRSDYLSAVQPSLPLDYLEAQIQAHLDANMPGTAYSDTLRVRTLNAESLQILPADLQFRTIAVTAEYSDLPDSLIHKVRFNASDTASNDLFDVTLETFRLSNQRLALTFEAETIEDQEIINSFGGLDNTPGYLVRLRPVLRLNGQRQAVSVDGLASGEDFNLAIDFIAPHTSVQITNTHINGNFSLLGIVSQNGALADSVAVEDKDAERLFYESAVDYAASWYLAEDKLASLLQVTLVRPMPSLVTVGGVVEVEYLLDVPHGFDFKGAYVDADMRAMETVGGTTLVDASDPRVRFMELSALEGSALESSVLEDNLQVESISTTKLFGLAQTGSIPMLTIDAGNAGTLVPTLPFDTGVINDINQAVAAGQVVTVPDQLITVEDWTGIGYIKENLTTGESGWMLSGTIAGGMTAWGPERWDDYYRDRLTNPSSEPANDDPSAAVYIQKVSGSDVQNGTAGQPLPNPLQVVALDMDYRPVQGVSITFVTEAGGALFSNGQGSITVQTNYSGIASAPVTLGQQTADNPVLWWESTYTHNMQVGENIIDARLPSGSRLRVPFTAYGFPGPATVMVKTYGDDKWDSILDWAGFVKVRIDDQFGNPISNQPVDFVVQAAVDNSSCSNSNQDTRPTVLVDMGDVCIDQLPSYGQCSSAAGSKQVVTSHTGAGVQVIMGGIPEADHPIAVSSGALSETFTLHTYAFGNCSGNSPPAKSLTVSTSIPSDSFGNAINAAPPGQTVPMQARLKVTREGEIDEDYTFDCSGDPKTCTRIVGDRTYFVDTAFTSADVNFNGTAGSNQGGGLFTTNYTVQAGVNYVNITGNGTIDYRRANLSCSSSCSITTESYTDTGYTGTVVYGVEIAVPTDIMVAVDADGYATCDVPIEYTITPAEYTAGSAGIFIYQDNAPILYIPTELSGAGSGTLGRGFLFESGSTYEAEVVLNNGSSSVEIRSSRIALNYGAIKVESIEIKDGDKGEKKVPIPPGGYATALAVTQPAGRDVVWTIRHKEDGVLAEIDANSGQIYALPETETGWIIIRATDTENDCVYKEAGVFIGCPSCGDDTGYCSLNASSGFVELSSINVGMSLGKARGGQSAGDIFLRAEQPSATLATPRSLLISSMSREVEERFDSEDVIRQVMAPEVFVDIVTLDAFSFDMIFYDPADVTGETGGFYDVAPSAVPIAAWRISNPDTSATVFNRLSVTETRGGSTKQYDYVWDESTQTWSLNKGAGLQIVTREQTVNGSDRTVVETITDSGANVAAKRQTTYRTFAWGEEIVQQVDDPDGAALTTTTAYYTNPDAPGSYGRASEVLNPDGSWVRYEYDDQGRKITEIRPWLDAAPGTAAGAARAVYYDYTPVDAQDTGAAEDRYSPRTVTESILGIDSNKTFHAYYTNGLGERVEIAEKCLAPTAAYGDAANLRTVTIHNPSGTADAGSGRVKSVEYPDGRLDLYTYEFGAYVDGATVGVPGAFTAGSGEYRRETVLNATVPSPAGIAFKSTRQVNIYSRLGNLLLSEQEVYTGAGFERLSWVVQTYDGFGRVLGTYESDGTEESRTWSCCKLTSQTQADGIETQYTYDALNRMATQTRLGVAAGTWAAQSAIVTTFGYDAAGRVTEKTTSADSLSLMHQQTFDPAGRLETSTDPSNLVTTYVYDTPDRETSVVRPGGGTEIATVYRDGRMKSVTGTAVVPKFYDYGINADGTQWTRVYEGSLGSAKWEQTTTDALGRTTRIESPGFSGAARLVQHHYNPQGQLVRNEQTGQADTLIEYDELGAKVRQGVDLDRNGLLETGGSDRITDSDTSYTDISGSWWQETVQKVYAVDASAVPTTVSTNRVRISGLGAYVSETIAIDAHGNQTAARTSIDRALKQVTVITDLPNSTTDSRQISVNGLLMASRSQSDIETRFEYDALGRQTGRVDPRKGTAVTHYNAFGQVDYIQDAAGDLTSFTYYTDTGRKSTETDALNKTTRYLYNARGQVTHTWGAAAYPVQYEYDSNGRMERMHTYRGGSGWDNVVWPTGLAGTPDTTTWIYQESTGLLIAKQDAQGEQTAYTYSDAGQPATRTWARTDAGSPITTTYGYDPDSAELVSIDYSDATVDITFAYDRLGRPHLITDAVGTRTFAYNSQLQLDTETITGLYSKTITRTYETTTVTGRDSGFTVDADYSVTYGYDTYGRMNALGWDIGGATGSATYQHVAGSDLLSGMTTASGVQVSYAYEAQRDLRTQVQNQYGVQLVSQYDYRYDAIGRRTSVQNSGTAFAANAFNHFAYGDRNEVTGSNRYLGADIDDLSQPVDPETRVYAYDPVGNRTGATEGTTALTYAANSLNQYDTITTGGTPAALSYDADGNLVEHAGIAYTYNAENRLTTVAPTVPAENDLKLEFFYDYMGRRVSKAVYRYTSGSWVAETEIMYVYDGWNLIQEITSGGQPSVDKYYVWGLDLSQSIQGAGGVGGLVVTVQGALTYHYCYDANGNVGQLVDASGGLIAAHYEYDPYGNLVNQNGSYADENTYRFSTKYFDDETGLYYYGYRYYTPGLGRWINRDPIGEKGSLNLLSFVFNNPITLWDDIGLLVGSEGHGEAISPSSSYQLVSAGQNEADIAFNRILSNAWFKATKSYARNKFRLKYIGFNKIGTDKGNKFVFSCKYGWIDHGHFFKNAYGAYNLKKWIVAAFAESVEIGQSIIGSESAYSPEDKISNELGRVFGDRADRYDERIIDFYSEGKNRIMPKSEFFNISNEWNLVLKDAGAIKWNTGITVAGKTVKEWIDEAIQSYKNEKYKWFAWSSTKAHNIAEGQSYKKQLEIWKCLCGGDVPKIKELRY